ncbi:MAG TPA: hypothetical protein VFB55_03375 [Verrucomicrobiae bacterium]|nr:hypothetical protein [Verrucomicrobiae bacterium]
MATMPARFHKRTDGASQKIRWTSHGAAGVRVLSETDGKGVPGSVLRGERTDPEHHPAACRFRRQFQGPIQEQPGRHFCCRTGKGKESRNCYRRPGVQTAEKGNQNQLAQMKHFAQNRWQSSGKSDSNFFHPGEHSPTAAFKFAAVQRACGDIAQIARFLARRSERDFIA